MIHKFEVPVSDFIDIGQGIQAMWSINNLDISLRVGALVDLFTSENKSVRCQVMEISHLNQFSNFIMFRFELRTEQTDNEIFSNAYTSNKQREKLALPSHMQHECATEDDLARKRLLKKREDEYLKQKKSKGLLRNKAQGHLEQIQSELKQIHERFLEINHGKEGV